MLRAALSRGEILQSRAARAVLKRNLILAFVDAVWGGGAAALVQFLRSDHHLARGYRVIGESCAGRLLRKNRLCVSSLSVFACVFFCSVWTVQIFAMSREACFGCPLFDRRLKCDPSSRYYVRFDYFSRGPRLENDCRNDIFDFAAYCLKKGIRLCSSRPTRPPIDACGSLPF